MNAEGQKDSFEEQSRDEQLLINTSPERIGNTQNRPKKHLLRQRLALGAATLGVILAGVVAEKLSFRSTESADLTSDEIFARIVNPDKSLYIGAATYDPVSDRLLVTGRPLTSTIETHNRIYSSSFISGAGFSNFRAISGPSVQERILTMGINNTAYIGGEGDPNSSWQIGAVEYVPGGLMGSGSGTQLGRINLPMNPEAYTDIRNIENVDSNFLWINRRDLGYPDSNFIYDCMNNALTATQRLTYTGTSGSFLGRVDSNSVEFFLGGQDPNDNAGVVVRASVNRNTGNITNSQVLTRTSFGPSVIIRKRDDQGNISRISYLNPRTTEVGMLTPNGTSISKEYYRKWVDGRYPDLDDNSLNFLAGISLASVDWYGGQIYAKAGGSRPIIVGSLLDGTKVSYILNSKDDLTVKSVQLINDNGVSGLLVRSQNGDGNSEMYFVETNPDGSPKANARILTLGKTIGDQDEATPTTTNTPTASATQTPANTSTPTSSVTVSPVASFTPSPTGTPKPENSATSTPTNSPTSTATSGAMATFTPTSSSTPTPTRTSTATVSPTATKTGMDYKVYLPVAIRHNSASW